MKKIFSYHFLCSFHFFGIFFCISELSFLIGPPQTIFLAPPLAGMHVAASSRPDRETAGDVMDDADCTSLVRARGDGRRRPAVRRAGRDAAGLEASRTRSKMQAEAPWRLRQGEHTRGRGRRRPDSGRRARGRRRRRLLPAAAARQAGRGSVTLARLHGAGRGHRSDAVSGRPSGAVEVAGARRERVCGPLG